MRSSIIIISLLAENAVLIPYDSTHSQLSSSADPEGVLLILAKDAPSTTISLGDFPLLWRAAIWLGAMTESSTMRQHWHYFRSVFRISKSPPCSAVYSVWHTASAQRLEILRSLMVVMISEIGKQHHREYYKGMQVAPQFGRCSAQLFLTSSTDEASGYISAVQYQRNYLSSLAN